MRNFLLKLLPKSPQSWVTRLLLLVVAFLLLSPLSTETKLFFGADKVAHFLIFFSVTSWSCVVYSGNKIRQFALLLILYGLILEVMQMTLIPGRNFECMDCISDILGIFLGLFTFSKRL